METLIWNLAVLLGFEEQFVPTGETILHTKGNAIKGPLHWTESGENLENLELSLMKRASHPIRGSIQPTQQGWLLDSYHRGILTLNKKCPLIDRLSLINATVASIVFGMWDAHGENIFVTKEGKLKFFDNTRTLPNSNGYIRRDNTFMPAFRSSLFEIDDTFAPLTPEERALLQIKTNELLSKTALIDYFKTRELQEKIAALPPAWLDLESALNAMQDRMQLMHKALANPNVKNLHDLALFSIPGYRFAVAISTAKTLVDENQREKRQCNYHHFLHDNNTIQAMRNLQTTTYLYREIGYQCEVKKITNLNIVGLDIAYLKRLAEDSSLSCEAMMLKILNHIQETIDSPLHRHEMSKRLSQAWQIVQDIKAKAVLDNKDYNRQDSIDIVNELQATKKS